uniref:Dpy-19 like C-mannosyltransferase 3 n=1 Tax=Cyprinus carpio TaxID=7962 RepID=A0A8C1J292_CYPCA
MTAPRQRKGSKGKDPGSNIQNLKPDCIAEPRQRFATVGISLGLLCCIYVSTLHENDLWFSNIKEVEREISFRTECGLYYSYYKQMLKAPSIQQGLYELIHDNTTESKRTINILQRMNIYQEVFLSILYRILHIQTYLEPIYFYIYTVFALQTVYVIALFITSWLLSDSWLAGALSGVWYILNRVDTTRVEFTISLRENWSIPFFALQVAAITCYLRPQLKPIQQVILYPDQIRCLFRNHFRFRLVMKSLILFLQITPPAIKESICVVSLYLMQVFSLLLVWLLQFCNSMILGSLVLSFIVSALFIKHFQTGLKTGGFVIRVGKLALHTLLVLTLTFTINYSAKTILQLKSDEHIFKFIKAKFGFGATRDFDASLYLCEEAFGLLPLDTFERLAGTVLLYPYLCTLSVLFILLLLVALSNLSTNGLGQACREREDRTFSMRPDVAYNLLHTVFFGLLSFSTMRMKYLWTGHMCAFAAFGVCGKEVWSLYLRMRLIRYSVPIVILAFLYYKFWPRLMEEISELREFYDPDTVELMEWIRLKTPKRAVFAGSMQLLAGINSKLPHLIFIFLPSLPFCSLQVYQIYARQSAEEVHKVLSSVGADYIVLEDSICYERRHSRGCRLRDLLDLANGHIMDGPGENEPDLISASHPRFCEAIKTDMPPYSTLFTRVFKNKTFNVYKLKKLKKKNKAENSP